MTINPLLICYIIALMKKTKILVEKTLTPENAPSKGYVWVQDTIYDPQAPAIAVRDVFDLVTTKGYKLGLPVSRMGTHIFQGLYAPFKKTKSKK